jgi:hypothetical protein
MKPIQKKSKSYYLIFLCFIVAILICLSGYQILNLTNKDSDKKTKTKAEIIEVRYISDGNFELKVVYFINRLKYISNLITKDQKLVGDVITIYYNDNDPNTITDKSNQSMFYMGNVVISCGCCVLLFVLVSLFSKPEKSILESKNNNSLFPIQYNMKFPYYVPYTASNK